MIAVKGLLLGFRVIGVVPCFTIVPGWPTAYSKVTIQHNLLNRKNVTQNKKYKL
jgi:hypothetical protein